MATRDPNQSATTSFYASITDAAKIEKIVDYSFERNEKSNVLAIHPTRPLIAYLINIQRAQKISKGWSSGNETAQSPANSSINGHLNSSNADKIKTVSIRIIDYVTRQRCLAKGIYHARPADCVFTINSLLCTQADVIKLAVVDRLANIYLYDLSYFINDLTATRIAVIRAPGQDVSPYEYISLVWCPFVPCEDFDDGDGGLRLALATNSRIEIFAIDRIQGKTGELQRNELKGAYKCINDALEANIVTLSISPDCSTLSAAALNNRVTFFSSDIDECGQRCLHNWEASITDKSSISKLFFLDDYQKLLEDSTMKFWGTAFIGTKSGQMLLVNLRNWSVYQRMNINSEAVGPKNFDYQIDCTSRNIIAMNENQCFVVQIEHDFKKLLLNATGSTSCQQGDVNLIDANNSDLINGGVFNYSGKMITPQRSNQKSSSATKKRPATTNNASSDGLPRIIRTTRLGLHNPIYSFVIKHKSNDELEMFTISAYSLERYIINLNTINSEAVEDIPISASLANESRTNADTPHELKLFLQQFDGNLRISSSAGNLPSNTPISDAAAQSKPNIKPEPNVIPATPKTPIKQQELDLLNLMSATMSPYQNQPSQVSTATTAAPIQAAPLGINLHNAAVRPNNASVATRPIELTNLEMSQMDRMVEALFTKLNSAFSQGLEEFLNDVKCEVNDLKLKLNGLCRDVRKLQQQLQEAGHK